MRCECLTAQLLLFAAFKLDKNDVLINIIETDLKWMIQCQKDIYQNSILGLEYAYLLFNEFKMNI